MGPHQRRPAALPPLLAPLLPCPHCGTAARLKRCVGFLDQVFKWQAHCTRALCSHGMRHPTREGATAGWNRRTPPQPPVTSP